MRNRERKLKCRSDGRKPNVLQAFADSGLMRVSPIRRSRLGKSMKIDIERLGLRNVGVDPDTLFTFPAGIAGFEHCRRFKLFHEEGGETKVFWLQSVDDSALMFPIVAPEALDIEYQIELGDEDCALIDMKDSDDVAVVVIVYRNETEGGKIAANTRSPVILNLKSRKGMQKILQDVHPTLLYRAR